jgi:hypothetical protein
MEVLDFTGSSNFVITAVILVGYEIVKSLISKGLTTKQTVEEALWKKEVATSLINLIEANNKISDKLDTLEDKMTHNHVTQFTNDRLN